MALPAAFPGDYYGNDFAKSFDFNGFFQNNRQKEEAFKNQEINRQQALEDLYFSQQYNPLKVQRASIDNAYQTALTDSEKARLPGIFEDVKGKRLSNDSKEIKNKLEQRDANIEFSIPEETRRQAILTKLAASMHADELKSEEAQIEKFILNPTIPEPVRNTFKQLREQFRDIYKLKLQLDSGERRAETAADARERVASMPRPSAGTAPKPPKRLEEVQAYWLQVALNATDEEDKQAALAKAQEAEAALKASKQDTATAKLTGTPDLEKVGVATHKGIDAPKKPQAPAGRIVIYKDGKPVGTVPLAQKEAAIKQGYKVD